MISDLFRCRVRSTRDTNTPWQAEQISQASHQTCWLSRSWATTKLKNKDCITGTRFNHGTCSGCLYYKRINWYNLTLEYSAVGLNRIILNTFVCNEASSVATTENDWDELAHVKIKLDCLIFQLEDQCESWLRLAKENKLPDLPRRTSLRTVANILVS